jgi:hypothetical protein
MRFFPMMASIVLAVTAFNMYAAPSATAPRLDLLSDGLNPAAAINYFYEEPKGEREQGSRYCWEISSDAKTWQPYKETVSRYLPLSAGEREKWLKVKIIPQSAAKVEGAPVYTPALLIPADPTQAALANAVVSREGSGWVLDKGLRQWRDSTVASGGKNFGRLNISGADEKLLTPEVLRDAESILLYNVKYNRFAAEAKPFLAGLKAVPELAAVNELATAGDLLGAVEAYQPRFLANLANLGKRRPGFGYIPNYFTTADKLMNNRFEMKDVNTKQTVEFDLGAPGYMNWLPVNNLNKDMVTHNFFGHFAVSLVHEYRNSKNAVYAQKWGAYVGDFFQRCPEQWGNVMKSPMANYFSALSVGWGYGFYSAVRISSIWDQWAQLAEADPARMAKAFSAWDTIRIINCTIKRNNPLLYNRSIPNQEAQHIIALLKSALVMADFKIADDYQNQAKKMTKDYIANQMMPDGTDLEQAIAYNFYGAFSLFMNCGSIFSAKDKFPWIDELVTTAALERLAFLTAMQKPNQQYPNLQSTGESNYQGILKIFLQSFSEANSAAVINGKAPDYTSVYLPYGGYGVQRNGWNADALYLFFKNSRRGSGHFDESFNHIAINAYGQNILVAGGGPKYSGSPFNGYMHGSSSKNTVTVDGFSQIIGASAKPAEIYRVPIAEPVLISDEVDCFNGTYRGDYGTSSGEAGPYEVKVTKTGHHRMIVFLKRYGVWLLLDRVWSDKPHTFQQNWNFPDYYGNNVNISGNLLESCAPDKPNIAIWTFGSDAVTAAKFFGQKTPTLLGWYNLGRDKESFPAVHAAFEIKTQNGYFITIIHPLKPGEKPLKPEFKQSANELTFTAGGDKISASVTKNIFTITAGEKWTFTAGGNDSGLYVQNQLLTPFKAPKKFQWQRTGNRLSPVLEY